MTAADILTALTVDNQAVGTPPAWVQQAALIAHPRPVRFAGRVVAATTFGPHDAVIPEVEGRAWITGRSEFCIDPEDPLKDGFILR